MILVPILKILINKYKTLGDNVWETNNKVQSLGPSSAKRVLWTKKVANAFIRGRRKSSLCRTVPKNLIWLSNEFTLP
jgi:hypothetical protein